MCGDSIIETGEDCDDGNTQACDGCSPACRTEACGNGVIDCAEHCDAGVPFPPPASGCTATCTEYPPALRIPGGGGRSLDCGHEWAIAFSEDSVARDPRAVPRNRQDCVDGDPGCDFDPAPGRCRLHVFQCLGGADPRLGCAAAGVAAVEVCGRRRRIRARHVTGFSPRSRRFPFPAGPGETCAPRVDVDLPAGRQRMVIAVQARLTAGKRDRDNLKLRCLPAPGS